MIDHDDLYERCPVCCLGLDRVRAGIGLLL
jgi:hypothetical protein